jgi:hypothetical protein
MLTYWIGKDGRKVYGDADRTPCGLCETIARDIGLQRHHAPNRGKEDRPGATKGGAHTTGKAADIGVERGEAYEVLKLALEIGFTGIGVAQKGSGRFLHLDICEPEDGMIRPTVWSY